MVTQPEMVPVENAPPAEAPRFETVTAYLSWDHERMELLLDSAVTAAAERRFPQAREAFRGFDTTLHRHIGLEESLLFPLFEARTGLIEGPVAAMRHEHRAIQDAVATMRDALDRSDAPAFAEGLRFLRSVLAVHESKEEHVLYPITDALLTRTEARTLLLRLERE